jgi:hypothetical protein
MAWYLYPLGIVAGFVAGFINTLAGSGSLITLPLLIFMGLPANIANGTNRVGVLFQNLVASHSFYAQKRLDLRSGLILALPSVIGSLIGAQIAVNLDEQMMRQAIGGLMIAMLVIMLLDPQRWLKGRPEALQGRPGPGQVFIFFCIGIYGGFIQAGVGIFLLAGLVLSVGYDLVHANAVKVLITFCLTASALLVFIYNGQVWWGVGILLAVGNSAGAWVAARMAVKRGANFVRWLVIAVVVVSAADLLGARGWVVGLFR